MLMKLTHRILLLVMVYESVAPWHSSSADNQRPILKGTLISTVTIYLCCPPLSIWIKWVRSQNNNNCHHSYHVCQWFRQLSLTWFDGFISGSSQFLLLPQLPQKMQPSSKVSKNHYNASFIVSAWIHSTLCTQKSPIN